MELQNWLREYKGADPIAQLKTEYAIDSKIHKEYPNLYLLKYNQIESDFNHKLVRQARGILFDRDNNWKVISRTYDKFFNHGESLAAPIDWATAKIYEKLDGSLAQLYYYDNKWQVATSGSPDASGEVNNWKFTFKDLFWKVWEELGYEVDIVTHMETYSLAFELCTIYNKIVVSHPKNKLVLHGARSLCENPCCNFKEISIDNWGHRTHSKYEIVKTYDLNNLDEVIQSCFAMNGLEQEGFVVCDANFNRIKIKSEDYLRWHYLKSSLAASPRALLDIVRHNETSECIVGMPEYIEDFNKIKLKLWALVKSLATHYDAIKHITNQKEFALEAVKSRIPSALFSLRAGKVSSIKEYLSNMRIENLEEVLQLKEIS